MQTYDKCLKKNSHIFLQNNDCKTPYIDIYTDLLSINFNLLSVLWYYAYHQICNFEMYTSLTTIWQLNTLFFLTWLVLYQIMFFVYVFRNPLDIKKKYSYFHTLSAYNSILDGYKVFSSDPREYLCKNWRYGKAYESFSIDPVPCRTKESYKKIKLPYQIVSPYYKENITRSKSAIAKVCLV